MFKGYLGEAHRLLDRGYRGEPVGKLLGHPIGGSRLDAQARQDTNQVLGRRKGGVYCGPGEVDDEGGQVGSAVQQVLDGGHGLDPPS
jgi:hypothetical protein